MTYRTRRVALCLLALPLALRADDVPPVLQGVKLETRLNQQVPLEVRLSDEEGKDVRLGDFLRPERPAILLLAYFRCPNLCNLAITGLSDGLRELAKQRGFLVGKELDVIVVSFDPRDRPDIAYAKKQSVVAHYGVPGATSEGWHFLTGREKEIRRLTDAVGFRYRYDYKTGEYAHASGILVLTPSGRISRVLHDVKYAPSDLYYSLVEASEYRIGTPLRDRAILLFCYSYDPERGAYQMRIINVVRICGVLTIIGIAVLIWRLRRAEKIAACGLAPGLETGDKGGDACSPSFG
jgi:protein SCO1